MSYSLSKSLGDNAIGLTAYYLSSPFNLLLYFTDNIPLFVSIATVLKLASASLTVSVFLSYRFCDMKYIWNLLLSVSYGLMGYNLCQASNIMWLDGVIWLPILMLSIWKLLSERRTLLLYLSVVFAIISNWYTAYMICLFSFFYFTYEALKKHDFSFMTAVKKEFSCFIIYCITAVSSVLTTMFFFLPVIKNLLQKADTILIGGGMSYTFLAAQGRPIGTSLLDADHVDYARQMLDQASQMGVNLLLPLDNLAAKEFSPDAAPVLVDAQNFPEDLMGMDIGPKTIQLFTDAIRGAGTVIWNGPMGVFEFPAFAQGTRAVAAAMAQQADAVTIVGGGDSASAVEQTGLAHQLSHISTGGGASLEFLEGLVLPGIACLADKEQAGGNADS